MGKYNLSSFVPSVTNPVAILASHDAWLNQPVTTNSDVTFEALHVKSDAVIDGNFTILGTTFESESTIVKYKTHMLVINDGEMGNGVLLNEAGIEVDRGVYENVRIVFRESDTTFRVGKISDTQAIATREDEPIDGGFMIWNDARNTIVSTNSLLNDVIISSPTPAASIGTGALVITSGGASFGGDIYTCGTLNFRGTSLSQSGPSISTNINNTLHLQSHADILLTAQNIGIPDLTSLSFGSSSMVYSENNSLFLATGSDGCVRFSNIRDALNKTSASVIFYGGVSVNKSVVLGGSTDYNIQATNSDDRLRIQSVGNLRPTVCCITGTQSAPDTELRISGSTDDRYITIKAAEMAAEYIIQTVKSTADTSAPEIVLTTNTDVRQLALKADGSIEVLGDVRLLASSNSTLEKLSAVPRSYVDNLTQKGTVRLHLSTEIAIGDVTVGMTIDGTLVADTDRILVTNCLDSKSNGIWIVHAGGHMPTRPFDFMTGTNVNGCTVFVSEGVVDASNGYICTFTGGTSVVDTDFLFFTKFTGLGLIDAGSGLEKTNNSLNVRVDNFSVGIQNDKLCVLSTGLSTGLTGGSGVPISVLPNLPSVVEVGTLVGSSEWNGQIINTSYGGTGRSSFIQNSLLRGNLDGDIMDDNRLTWDTSTATLTVDGSITTSGPLTTPVIDRTSTLTTHMGQNCSNIIVHSADIAINGNIITLHASIEAQITVDHELTVFDVDLPQKTNAFVGVLDAAYCFINGMCVVDATSIGTNLENIVFNNVPGSTKSRITFTSNLKSYIHVFKIYARYTK